ncbi:MAG: nickel pincer cofactor biosynthesis protein LarC [Phycisphaerae bacterium]
MRTCYFDCFSGAAGDMILAALVDAGCPIDDLRAVVARLNLAGVELHAERVKRHGIAATLVRVAIGTGAPRQHRHLSHILKIIAAAELPAPVAANASAVFRRLAEAEAAVHATTVEKVHFHEVGADDAIVDIVGAAAALHLLGVERVVCSPIPTGSGSVMCEHGLMPVPAPATAKLLVGAAIAACDEPGELTTPTGAAILTTLAAGFGGVPAMQLTATGCGAGTREGKTRANILRVLIGDSSAAETPEHDVVCVLEAQVDDLSPQTLAYACEQVLHAGALDVFTVPIVMKKGRAGQLVTVLCAPGDRERIEAVLFRETSTFGVRRHEALRSKLRREHVAVATEFGPIRVKVGRLRGDLLQATPEYEDCAAAARRSGVALRHVQGAAMKAWMQSNDA